MNKFLQNIFILLIFILINLCSSIIVLPFKTYTEQEPSQFTSPSDIFKYWSKNIIYTNALIGTPPQNISIILNSQSYSTSIFNHMCDIPYSFYEKEKSSSYVLDRYINSYSTMSNASLIKETLYLFTELNTKEYTPINSLSLIYSQNLKEDQGKTYQYHPYTCMNLGLQMGWTYMNDYQANFISQLRKKLNKIETYDFTLEYLTNTEGRIIIGNEPHFYDEDKYSELQYRISGAADNQGSNQRDFFLNFDSINLHYINNGKEHNDTIPMTKSAKIVIDMGMILGPKEYKENIDRIFFYDLKKNGKCKQEEISEKNLYFYYCDKNSAENDIKNNFPDLFFEMKQFHKTFILTYEDLFRVKNDKIYFLIYFRNYNFGNYFELGKIFLQKYSFTFNQETKMIGYYNFDLPGGKNKNNNDKTNEQNNEKNYFENIYIWLGVSVIVIGFAALGFFIGKIVYDKVRKRRINEVDDDNYYYNTQQNKEDNKLCDNIDE